MDTNNLTEKPDIKTDNKINNKVYWIECIRVFSAFLIVMNHSISSLWTTLPPETIEWKIMNLIFLISRCAVPVFFMCSGMGMLAKERSIENIFKKNIFSLLKIYILWMLVYGARDAISLVRDGYGIRIILNAFIKNILFGQYHTWFIMTLVGLYLITPLLYEIVKKEKLMKYFLILSVLFTVILPLAVKADGSGRLNAAFETFNMRFVIGYVMYYVLGYYLSRMTWPKHHAHALSFKGRSCFIAYTVNRKKALITTIILFTSSVFAAFAISCMISVRNGEANQTVYLDFSPLALAISASLLMLFQLLITTEKHRKLISRLGSCGTGIYLMHPLLLPIASCFPGVSRLLGGIIVYLTALIICLMLKMPGKLFQNRKQA